MSILVAIDGTTAGEMALASAITVAARHARLTLLGAFGAPHWSALLGAGYVPFAAAAMSHEECAATLRSAARRVPDRLACHWLARRGTLDAALAGEAAAGAYDLVVLPGPWPSRTSAVLGLSACARLVRASSAPVLVVPRARARRSPSINPREVQAA